ncbi:hypothetical protein XA68_18416 [Ophiocordyceps unilateralis]|uniref:Increased recombination centers protein 6 n=1 Tax=Ophiocordyceps unilateralis TaxID=268505 RepID=A0A2A9PI26_OPHUN|nr:hypothetical protein XA68_18416 [Ophiocordyceps unilateralis]
MQVSNPKRLLAVSLEQQADHLSRVLQDLTGQTPSSSALAGTTHDLGISTRYYNASIPVWLDLIAAPTEWADSFLSDEAVEVLAVLGGLIVVFGLPANKAEEEMLRSLLVNVGRVVHGRLGGWEWDGVRLAIGVGDDEDGADTWDEVSAEAGFEFVRVGMQKSDDVDELGERIGIARVQEALEANDWTSANETDLGALETASDQADDECDAEDLTLGLETMDLDSLKKAIYSTDQDDETIETGEENDEEIIKLEAMMRKLQAVREAGSEMGQAQKRLLAAKAVAEVMREL